MIINEHHLRQLSPYFKLNVHIPLILCIRSILWNAHCLKTSLFIFAWSISASTWIVHFTNIHIYFQFVATAATGLFRKTFAHMLIYVMWISTFRLISSVSWILSFIFKLQFLAEIAKICSDNYGMIIPIIEHSITLFLISWSRDLEF